MYLDTSSLTQKQKDILLLRLKKDADEIFVQWDEIVDEFSSWMEENVSVEVYKKILLTVPGVTSAVKEVKMLNDRKQKIMDAKCHLDCFAILLDYHSWFNWSILEAVISSANRKTQKDPSEFLSRLKFYVHQLHQYCKRNIFECPALSCMSSTKSKTYLVLKVTEDQLSTVDMVSAEKIQQFTAELMKPFEIEEYVLNLHTVGTGCMEMVYSIPQCIYNELFPLNEDQCYSLATLGVMEIITKDCHYKKDHVSDMRILLRMQVYHIIWYLVCNKGSYHFFIDFVNNDRENSQTSVCRLIPPHKLSLFRLWLLICTTHPSRVVPIAMGYLLSSCSNQHIFRALCGFNTFLPTRQLVQMKSKEKCTLYRRYLLQVPNMKLV